MYPENFRYTKEHEWVKVEGDTGTVGLTDHAQKELGDIVYVDLPKVGSTVEKGKTIGSVESVKAVSDSYSPVSVEGVSANRSARRQGPHQLPIAERIIDPPHARPELLRPHERQWKCGLLARIGMLPRTGRNRRSRVRCVLQHVVPRIGFPVDHPLNLPA